MASSALVDLSGVSILCVDDDPVMRAVVRAALFQRGCRDIVQATNGESALGICTKRSFDLVICDYQMVPMTGLDFLHALSDRGIGAGWRVIMLTAETDPDAVAAIEALGVNTWVRKPISTHNLLERVGATLAVGGDGAHETSDPARRELAERHNAMLMANLAAIEEAVAALAWRASGDPDAWRAIRRRLDTIIGQAGMFGYALMSSLGQRGTDLVSAAEQTPSSSEGCHREIAGVLTMVITAMKRVGQNRMRGDGGEAGARLLARLDLLAAPLKVRIDIEIPGG
jgi:two-component system chemotaxis response regulator CheY